MNKNPEAMKQYLADRTARAGAELRELTGTDTVLLPVTGEPKLYVAVGPMAGIAHTAQRSLGEAAGNTNKAVLTDDQIISAMRPELDKGDGGYLCDIFPAGVIAAGRAIEAAVLANASKAVVAEPLVFDDFPVFNEHAMGCGLEDRNINDRYDAMRYGFETALDLVDDRIKNFLADIAPAPTDNPSTAGAELPTDEQVADVCWVVRPDDFKGEGDSVDYLKYDGAVVRGWLSAAQVAQSTAGAEEIIDSPEFMELLASFYEQASCEEFNEAAYNADRRNLVQFISSRLSAPASPAQPSAADIAFFEGVINASDFDFETGMIRITVKLPGDGLPIDLRTIGAPVMIAAAQSAGDAGGAA